MKHFVFITQCDGGNNMINNLKFLSPTVEYYKQCKLNSLLNQVDYDILKGQAKRNFYKKNGNTAEFTIVKNQLEKLFALKEIIRCKQTQQALPSAQHLSLPQTSRISPIGLELTTKKQELKIAQKNGNSLRAQALTEEINELTQKLSQIDAFA